MKEENLNNKKQEWVTPKISQMGVEDTEGNKDPVANESASIQYIGVVGPSWSNLPESSHIYKNQSLQRICKDPFLVSWGRASDDRISFNYFEQMIKSSEDTLNSEEKLEWVTPKISQMGVEDTQGNKYPAGGEYGIGLFTYGPS